MAWKEKMDEWGGGEVSFLSEDGEAAVFIIVGDPVLLTGKFKNRPSERIGCPAITADGYTLLIIGKRLARRIARHEIRFDDNALMVVRHGEHNDIETTYELTTVTDRELTDRLFAIKKTDFNPEMIDESVAQAREIMQG